MLIEIEYQMENACSKLTTQQRNAVFASGLLHIDAFPLDPASSKILVLLKQVYELTPPILV